MLLPAPIHEAIVAHGRFCLPDEACGLLASDRLGRLRFVYCLSNVDPSPARFTVDPVEHFRALAHAERYGWELSGVFHSHVSSAAYPSPTDVAMAEEPGWLHVLVGPMSGRRPSVRGYRIRGGGVSEEPLTIV